MPRGKPARSTIKRSKPEKLRADLAGMYILGKRAPVVKSLERAILDRRDLAQRFIQSKELSATQRSDVLNFIHNFVISPRRDGRYRIPTLTELAAVFPYIARIKKL